MDGLKGLAAATPKGAPVLLCLSHLRWDFVWQRPQHLLSRASRHFRVIFLEEPVYSDRPQPGLETDPRGGVTVVRPLLPHGLSEGERLAAQRAVVDGLLAPHQGAELVVWYYTPAALAYADHLAPDAVVYDNMDELSAFRFAAPELLRQEDELFSRADVVFTGGASLYEAKRHRHRNIHCYPSSIEADHFGAARGQGADPQDQAAIAGPRLGFFGVIDERMDLDLVRELARLRPDWQIVMIGPTAKIAPEDLPQAANLHWLGPKRYEELPAYLRHWDVGIMPFARNEATRFISPTKTPEFLAAGLPVVSTGITDVVSGYGAEGLVAIAHDAEGFAQAAEAMLARGDAERQEWLGRVDRKLAAGSWDSTFEAMHQHLHALVTGARAPSNPARAQPLEGAHV